MTNWIKSIEEDHMNLTKLVHLSYSDEEEAHARYNIWLNQLVSKRSEPIKKRRNLQSVYRNKKCVGLVDPAKRCYYDSSSEDENGPFLSAFLAAIRPTTSHNGASSPTMPCSEENSTIDSTNTDASPSMSPYIAATPSYSPTSPNGVSSTGLEDVSDDELDIGISPLLAQDADIEELLKIVFDDLHDPMTEETSSNVLIKDEINYITID